MRRSQGQWVMSRSRGQTPAEARYEDEKTETDESDADDRGGRIDTQRECDDQRDTADHCQTSSYSDKHQRGRLKTSRGSDTRASSHWLTWT